MELLCTITQEPLSAGTVQHFIRPVLQFSFLEPELAFRLINTKDTVTQAAFTFTIHYTPHLPRENFADNLKALSW